MKKIALLIMLICLALTPSRADEVLRGGVSLASQVPQGFFGKWKVNSELVHTTSMEFFAPYSIDQWTMMRSGDTITLENPESGAIASVTVNQVKGNTITFTRTKKDQYEEMTETPTITLVGENFYGTDKITIKKYKYNTLVKQDVVEFIVRGEKLYGSPVTKIVR